MTGKLHTAKVWEEDGRTYWECRVCCTGGSSGDWFKAEDAGDRHHDEMLLRDSERAS